MLPEAILAFLMLCLVEAVIVGLGIYLGQRCPRCLTLLYNLDNHLYCDQCGYSWPNEHNEL